MGKDFVEEVRKNLFCAENAECFQELAVGIRRYGDVCCSIRTPCNKGANRCFQRSNQTPTGSYRPRFHIDEKGGFVPLALDVVFERIAREMLF